MKKIMKGVITLASIGALSALPFSVSNAQDCTEAEPCDMILHADIGTDAGHIQYGDTITLRYEGDDDGEIVMIENVAEWDSDEEIELEPIVVWIPGPTALDHKLVPGWEFEVESDGEEHEGFRLYRDPDSDEWLIVAPQNMHGEVHGGTAHMR